MSISIINNTTPDAVSWANLACNSLTSNSVSVSQYSTLVKFVDNLGAGSPDTFYTIPAAAGSSVRVSFGALATTGTSTPGFMNTIPGLTIVSTGAVNNVLTSIKLTEPGFYSFSAQANYTLNAAFGTSQTIGIDVTIDVDGVTSTYKSCGELPVYDAGANLNNMGTLRASGVFLVPEGSVDVNIVALLYRPASVESDVSNELNLIEENLNNYILITKQ